MKPLSFFTTVVLPLLALCTYLGLIFAVGLKLLVATLVGLTLGHVLHKARLCWEVYKKFLADFDSWEDHASKGIWDNIDEHGD